MTTTLIAVNQMLEAIGEPAVTALDSGGTSEAGEAEYILGRVSREVQSIGWWHNTIRDVTLTVPDVKILVSGGSGTFTYGETVTESVSGATGTFSGIVDASTDYMLLTRVSGTFTGGQTLTGGTSAATKTGSTYTAVTTARIGLDPDWLVVSPTEGVSAHNLIRRGDWLYDLGDADSDTPTYDFSSSVRIDYIEYLDFTDLSESLAAYIVATACVRFQRFKKRATTDDAFLREAASKARLQAIRENTLLAKPNITTTGEAMAVKGDRVGHVGTLQ